jgi:hypothetical protein
VFTRQALYHLSHNPVKAYFSKIHLFRISSEPCITSEKKKERERKKNRNKEGRGGWKEEWRKQ